MYTPDPRLEQNRQRLLDELKAAGIRDQRVLNALAQVRREAFVPIAFRHAAYANRALPIGEEQTISQPSVVALMTHALDVAPHHKVLEIGTGSGYQAAVLCKMVRRLFTIERFESLAAHAESKLHELGIYNFAVRVGDGTLGWPEQAPFDRIIVTAAAPEVPPTLLAQLAPGGIMVIPVGESGDTQKLMRYVRHEDGSTTAYFMGYVRFVPLVGREGAKDKQANHTQQRHA